LTIGLVAASPEPPLEPADELLVFPGMVLADVFVVDKLPELVDKLLVLETAAAATEPALVASGFAEVADDIAVFVEVEPWDGVFCGDGLPSRLVALQIPAVQIWLPGQMPQFSVPLQPSLAVPQL
jgi:hypothetical protein